MVIKPDVEIFLTTTEAAQQAGVSPQTIVNWCRDYGIGTKVGGQWRVDPDELEKVLDGSIHKELERRRHYETYQ